MTKYAPAMMKHTVIFDMPMDVHNPGGPGNQILESGLNRDREIIQSAFADVFMDYDGFRVKTVWSFATLGHKMDSLIRYQTTVDYAIRDSDGVDVDGLINEAIKNCPSGVRVLSITEYNELDDEEVLKNGS